jgi:hypothetical protein
VVDGYNNCVPDWIDFPRTNHESEASMHMKELSEIFSFDGHGPYLKITFNANYYQGKPKLRL